MKKALGFAALLATSALILAGCASSSTSTGDATIDAIKVDSAAAALLPDTYKTNGINVGSDIPYAPMEMFDENNNPIGFDVDLANAIGKKLGVKIIYQKQAFDTLIASLEANKHDVAMSSLSDTVERQAKLDFVDYFNGGASLLVAKGNPNSITSIDTLCGQPVAVQTATWEVDLVQAASDECVADNQAAIEMLSLPGDVDAQNAVRSGKAVAYLGDSQVVAYAVKVAGDGDYFDLVVDPENPYGYDSGLIGVGVLKANTGLTAAIQAAVQSLMDDGTYAKLVKKWNLESFAIDSATLNGTK
jgi:polar amino acid transport system substrate-binding protein